MKGYTIAQLARGGMIAALYAMLALGFPEISYGIIQFRLSEALVLLPRLFPEAIPGLAIGCFISNLGSPFGLLDIVGGTICTLLAAYCSYRFRNIGWLAVLAPIVINGAGVSIYVAFISKELYLATMPLITLGEAIVVVALALPLYLLIKRKQ